MIELMKKVKNVPASAWDYPVWIVTNLFEDGVWFYGAYRMDERNRANEIAMELGKEVYVRED